MTLRHPDAIGALAIVIVAIIVLFGGLTTPDPGFGVVSPAAFPIMLGVLMLAAAGWLALQTRGAAIPAAEPTDRGPLAGSLAATALFLVAFVPMGFVLSAPPYFVAQARILGSRALVRDVIVAVIFTAVIYLLFVRLLTIDLPKGPLPL
ncbi:MAG: tripartite tricarboxylate transporter TctB family protein [Chloroflexota bacterium]